MNSAIKISNLGKCYRVGKNDLRAEYATLRESLTNAVTAPFRRLKSQPAHCDTEEFWALRDVSFEVQPGEVVAVIGRNGAGKSTLLKTLTRITPPTTGKVSLRGRVGSLLEVGTGFHPELTGRENIYLNGAILGMCRQEIRRKFDEIVAFAGVERFLDTPVKRYSSGMYVRLAFAVAAHLELEILLVDEVLAVGDVEFQKRCLSKMEDVGQSGRTVIFVSHNMAALQSLCRRGIVLDRGQLVFDGTQDEAIGHYMSMLENANDRGVYRSCNQPPQKIDEDVHVVEARVMSNGNFASAGYPVGAPLEFRVTCYSREELIGPLLELDIDSLFGSRIVTLRSDVNLSAGLPETVQGEFEFTVRTEDLALKPGEYRLRIKLLSTVEPLEAIDDALTFSITDADYYRNGGKLGRGLIVCPQSWQLRPLSTAAAGAIQS